MKPSRIFQTYIRTAPDALWNALTDGAMTEQYYYGTRAVSSWQVGDTYNFLYPDGSSAMDGQVLESDPPHSLRITFHPTWEPGLADFPPSIIAYQIEPQGSICKLTVTMEDLAYPDNLLVELTEGQAFILSGLKTLLETGAPLVVAESVEATGV